MSPDPCSNSSKGPPKSLSSRTTRLSIVLYAATAAAADAAAAAADAAAAAAPPLLLPLPPVYRRWIKSVPASFVRRLAAWFTSRTDKM